MQVPAVRGYSAVSPSFEAKIIDSHAHLGRFMEKDYGLDALDKFVKSNVETSINGVLGSDTIEKMIVSNMDAIEGTMNEIDGNKKILNMIGNRKEYLPMAVCQPAKTGGDVSAIEKLLAENPNKFVGLKFHPTCLPLANDAEYAKAYLPYMELAKKHNLPCLFHCQGGQASADRIYELAQKVPDVPVILGHSGSLAGEGRPNRDAALRVFKDSLDTKKANILLDLSWVGWGADDFPAKKHPEVKEILEIAKDKKATNKILFGTDAPLGCFGTWESPHFSNKVSYSNTVSYFKEQIHDVFGKEGETVANKIFYENANNMFVKNQRNNKIFNNKHLKHAAMAIGVMVLGLGALAAITSRNKSDVDKFKHKIKH